MENLAPGPQWVDFIKISENFHLIISLLIFDQFFGSPPGWPAKIFNEQISYVAPPLKRPVFKDTPLRDSDRDREGKRKGKKPSPQRYLNPKPLDHDIFRYATTTAPQFKDKIYRFVNS